MRRPPGGGRYEFLMEPSAIAITYKRWAASQPLRGTDYADCVVALQPLNWRWNDGDCPSNEMYMCKIEE